MNERDHLQRQIDELQAVITELDGQSGVLIRLRASLTPVKDAAMRRSLEISIQTMINDIAQYRHKLNELTGGDSGEVSEH
jgi:hypothetical protein